MNTGVANIISRIFNEKDFDFNETALEIFQYQYENNPVYNKFVRLLGTKVSKIKKITDIPFLPVEFFKTQVIHTKPTEGSVIFTSSSTTGNIPSRHFVYDISLYEKSFIQGFEMFYGPLSQYCFLALLPSYIERGGSSLVYMAQRMIDLSGHSDSGFYLYDDERLIDALQRLEDKKQKTILLGVSFALLDLAQKYPISLKNTIVMETGGMKGRRKEIVRDELHQLLKQGFRVDGIHSEYGMTELLSQAYSQGNGVFNSPPWMKILIRDANDPFSYLENNCSGGINIIDFANIYSCCFIATQDLGKVLADGSFVVSGRFDNSDIRGCNLMASF